jgi:hypothetical protein
MSAGRHEFFDLIHAADAAACAIGAAVERSSRTGKVQLSPQWPSLQECINKSCVKNIAGACGVHDWNSVGASMVKLLTIPRQYAIRA